MAGEEIQHSSFRRRTAHSCLDRFLGPIQSCRRAGFARCGKPSMLGLTAADMDRKALDGHEVLLQHA